MTDLIPTRRKLIQNCSLLGVRLTISIRFVHGSAKESQDSAGDALFTTNTVEDLRQLLLIHEGMQNHDVHKASLNVFTHHPHGGGGACGSSSTLGDSGGYTSNLGGRANPHRKVICCACGQKGPIKADCDVRKWQQLQ